MANFFASYSGTNAVDVTGSITATNPSVGVTGTSVPADATYAGMNVSGNLTGLVGTANGLKVDGSAVTQPVNGTVTATQPTGTNLHAVIDSGTVAATQSGTWNITNISGTVSLPTGAATSALQTTGNTSLATIATNTPALGQAVMASSSPVVIASNQSSIPVTVSTAPGRSSVLLFNNINSSTNITTSAYVQITASTSSAINRLYIADTSGQSFIIATGASGSEVNQLYVGPGGNDYPYELNIPASTRVAVKALSANMTAGALTITGLS